MDYTYLNIFQSIWNAQQTHEDQETSTKRMLWGKEKISELNVLLYTKNVCFSSRNNFYFSPS